MPKMENFRAIIKLSLTTLVQLLLLSTQLAVDGGQLVGTVCGQRSHWLTLQEATPQSGSCN